MKGLFRKGEARQEDAHSIGNEQSTKSNAQKIFNFNFALPPGDDPIAHNMLIAEDAKKKKKKKKKKKVPKQTSIVSEGLESSDDDRDAEVQNPAEQEQPLVSPTQAAIPADNPLTSSVAELCIEKREGGGCDDSHGKKKKKKKKTNGDDNRAQHINSPALSNGVQSNVFESKRTSKNKSPRGDIDEEDRLLNEAIELATQEKKELKKELKAKKKADVTKGILANTPINYEGGKKKVPIDHTAPRILSPNDPEMDPQLRIRAKFGKGKNLVAIGPPKVRDPNWLPSPPGFDAPVSDNTAMYSSPFSFQFSFQNPGGQLK